MSDKVDSLFKEKLGTHSIAPSVQAWEKLEANLSKKNKSIIWFRIAAVLALGGLLIFVFFQRDDRKEKEAPLANTEKPSVKPAEASPATALTEKKNEPVMQAKKLTQQPSSIRNNHEEEEKSQDLLILPSSELVTSNEPGQDHPPVPQPEAGTQAVVVQKSIKLVYSLPSLEPRKDPVENAVAASPEENASPLKKALNEIRSGEILGDLRDAKDNLFALDFRKDKSKKN